MEGSHLSRVGPARLVLLPRSVSWLPELLNVTAEASGSAKSRRRQVSGACSSPDHLSPSNTLFASIAGPPHQQSRAARLGSVARRLLGIRRSRVPRRARSLPDQDDQSQPAGFRAATPGPFADGLVATRALALLRGHELCIHRLEALTEVHGRRVGCDGRRELAQSFIETWSECGTSNSP